MKTLGCHPRGMSLHFERLAVQVLRTEGEHNVIEST
jgi:hypothetical protein